MRTFSEDEARAVFARAAREQQAASDAGAADDGLTLDELQEIGRASGLDPDFVAAAAAGLSATPTREAPTLLGMPTELTRSRTLTTTLSDEVWEETVEALRSQFGEPGVTSQIGRTREWTGPSRGGFAAGQSVYVTVRPTPAGGSSVRIEQRGMKENAGAVAALTGTFAAFALAFTVVFALGSFEPKVMALPVLIGALAMLTGVGGALGMRAWARKQDDRFEAALDRIERIARTEAPTPRLVAPARETPLPDLPDLGDTFEGEGAAHAAVRGAASRLGLDTFEGEPDAETPRSGPSRTRA